VFVAVVLVDGDGLHFHFVVIGRTSSHRSASILDRKHVRVYHLIVCHLIINVAVVSNITKQWAILESWYLILQLTVSDFEVSVLAVQQISNEACNYQEEHASNGYSDDDPQRAMIQRHIIYEGMRLKWHVASLCIK